MKNKIDQFRDGAKVIEILDVDDQTPLRFMFGTPEGLYVVKDKSIFLMQKADHIDPERTNINVSDVYQKVFSYGFDNPIVGKILVSGERLFSSGFMRDVISQETAMGLILKGTGILCEIHDLTEKVFEQISEVADAGGPSGNKGQKLPHTSNLHTNIDIYIRLADNLRQVLTDFLVSIYKPTEGKRLLENLRTTIHQKHGDIHGFCVFFDKLISVMCFIRELRNAWEHPKAGQKVAWKDFTMKPDGRIYSPTIELISDKYPQDEMDLGTFMKQCTAILIEQLEALIGNACAANCSFGGFKCGVMELPKACRPHPEARLTCAVFLNGQWQPIG
ncbi:hypothetical protein J1781_09145 [Rahnella sp. C60]|uniref:hypothetical protein n=1 Tax=Enterobacterales TaxID=91347 RepID=UPI001C273486|nr:MULTISPECIES: hypothetical protein [Enterobacterales]MBU9809523.1 hypothetical protein [Rahnella perminowiae]MBU9815014.1 hypothetical protein [Rahnella perminowiae]MBU9840254.1 hypothetical protein [Rahnella aceris]MBU9858800.1 hypothetical protein [Rahnella aceris]MBU9865079.1 hypothetical protein [Rahnella aceris]